MQGVLLFLMVDFFEGKFVSAVNNAITAKRVTKRNCISFLLLDPQSRPVIIVSTKQRVQPRKAY